MQDLTPNPSNPMRTFNDFESVEGQANLDALYPESHQGEINPITDLAVAASVEVLLSLSAKVGGKLLDTALDKYKDAKLTGTPTTDIQAKQLEVGKVESYKDAKKVIGDGSVHRDHQPSVQALLTRAEEIKGSPLTNAQKRAISENATTVTVPSDVHIAGPTYGGNNTPLLQQTDANDLQSAAIRDSNAMVNNAKVMAPDYVSTLLRACEGINCTTNIQYDDFLKKILAKKKKVSTKKTKP